MTNRESGFVVMGREILITKINDDNEIMKQVKGNKQFCLINFEQKRVKKDRTKTRSQKR